MNKDLTRAFVAIKDNTAVIFDTNLKDFVKKLSALESKARNYDYYSRQFKTQKVVQYVNESGEIYYLQDLLFDSK
jgi:hypothetical protein